MGSKRPDQAHVESGEPGAEMNEGLQDEHLREADKTRVAQSKRDAEHASMIPKSGENPALADLRARRAKQAEDAGASGEG